MRQPDRKTRGRRRQQRKGGSVEQDIVIDYEALADALLQKEPRLQAFRRFGRGPIDPRLLPEPN